MATGRVPTTANSPLTAKGDLFTYSTTQARLAVGSNGDTLLADSSTTTGLRWSGVAGANLLANGSFDIWQRGTSGFTTNQSYTADRWFTFSSSTYSISRETSIVPTGATNSLRVNITSANGFANLQYAMEQDDVIKLRGQTITFSVYLRADATYNGSFNMGIYSNTTGNTQTGGTWSALSGATTTHTPSTGAFNRVSVTGVVPTNANGLIFYIGQNSVLANNSNYYIALAKAEIGAVPTVWSRAGVTLQGELAACQRYYFRMGVPTSNAYENFGFGTARTTTGGDVIVQFPVTMRDLPASIDYANLAYYAGNIGASSLALSPSNSLVLASANRSKTSAIVYGTVASGFTANQPIYLTAGNSTAAYLGFSAEL